MFNKSATRYGSLTSAAAGPDSPADMDSGFLGGGVGSTEDNANFVIHEPPRDNADKNERSRSLDAFRGLVIAVMIWVDDTGWTYSGKTDHSPWDNITFADFVMPYFLFIVGLSMVLAHGSQNKEGQRLLLFWNTFKRALKLFLIGLIVQGADFGGPYDLSILRIPGILQRIAFCQVVVSAIELALPVRDTGFEDTSYFRIYSRYLWHWVATGVVLLIYVLLMYTTDVPGCGIGHATPQCNAAGYWDAKILGVAHMYSQPTYTRLPECSLCSPKLCPRADAPAWCSAPFDPEGIIASFAAVFPLFIGAFVGHIFEDTKANARERARQMGPLSIVLVIIGLIMHFSGIPMNKNLFSLSYIFFMAGTATACLLLFAAVIDMAKIEAPFRPLIWLGMNALFVFVMAACDVFETALSWVYWQSPQNNLVDVIRTNLFLNPLGADGGTCAYTALKIVWWVVVAGVMQRLKIFVKV